MITSKLKLFMVILLILIVGVSWMYVTEQKQSTDTRAFADMPDAPPIIPTAAISNEMVTEVMDSPDGAKSLSMERQKKGSDYQYSFHITDEELQEFLYAKELSDPSYFSIPYNTWSPDNTYFFLKEVGPSQDEYYVFHASGENFPNHTQYLNVQMLFEEKIDGYTIEEVTGWADPLLLLVNTKETNGEKKVSFWFNVTNQSFIKLGTYFR